MSWWKKLKRVLTGSRESQTSEPRTSLGEPQTTERAASRKIGPAEESVTPPKAEVQNEAPSIATKRRARKAKKVAPEHLELATEATQYEGAEMANQRQSLVIGLDFGTAYTKVVIGENRRAYAIPMRRRSKGIERYLLPGVIAINQYGECSLDVETGGVKIANDLKMSLIRGNPSRENLAEIVCFLALVLQRSRVKFLGEHAAIYKGFWIDWAVNIGMPTEQYDDTRLTETYAALVRSAWCLSTVRGPLFIQDGIEILDSNKAPVRLDEAARILIEQKQLSKDSFACFPEFLAQMAGYVRSPMRENDLHMLVDVGAGTVDISVFNVHRDAKNEKDKFPIFAKSVKSFGTFTLVQTRHEKVGKLSSLELAPFDKVPTSLQFAKRLGITLKKLQEIDNDFRARIAEQILTQLSSTKKSKYPKSRRWEKGNGVRTFLTGGGANVDFYKEILEQHVSRSGVTPIRLVKMDMPKRMLAQGVRQDDYPRLSVAFGLSFDAFDLGEVITTNEIDNLEASGPRETFREHFVGKEQV